MPPKPCAFCGSVTYLGLYCQHLPRCPIGTGGMIPTEDGGLVKRQRVVHQVLNLDILDEARLELLVGLWPSNGKFKAFARRLYPGRPRGYLAVSSKLYAMARLRLRGDAKNYEVLYRQLPDWAQWRQHFANVQKAVAPGKQFRKRPPRRKI